MSNDIGNIRIGVPARCIKSLLTQIHFKGGPVALTGSALDKTAFILREDNEEGIPIWSEAVPEALVYDLEKVDLISAVLADINPAFAGVEAIIIDSDDNIAEMEFDCETAYGEPQGWIYLKDGSSLEITFESNGLLAPERYYSLRHHCSEKDFENDVYHSTMGIIEECSGSLSEISPMLARICAEKGIAHDTASPVKHVVLPSKTLAILEDGFEAALAKSAGELLAGCLHAAGEGISVNVDDVMDTMIENDVHNQVKHLIYDLFSGLGYDIRPDGTSF